jgi:signal transduction protein with GAF and PtsI domain
MGIDEQTKTVAEIKSLLLEAMPQGEDSLWQAFIQALCKNLHCEAASYFSADDEHRLLTLRFAAGNCAEDLTNLTFGYKGIVGEVALQRKTLLVNNVEKDPAFCKAVDKASGFKTRAILCVPILHGKLLLGVLELLNPDCGAFSDTDRTITEQICAEAAKIVGEMHSASN